MTQDLHPVSTAVLLAVQRLLQVPFCLLTRVTGDSFVVHAEVGAPSGLFQGKTLPLADSLVGEVVSERTLVSFTDQDAVLPRLERGLGVRSALGFPLVLRSGTVIGALVALDREARTYNPRDVELCAGLARAAAADLEETFTFDRAAELERARLAGLLARGMAHDFGNVVSSALANVRSLHRLLGPVGSEAREALDELAASLEAGAELIARLRDVGRADPRGAQRRGLDPTAVASKVVAMARGLFTEASGWIDLRLQHPDRSIEIRGDEHAIEQALLNLVLNARDALKERGGRVTVRVLSQTVESSNREAPWMIPGTWAELVVDDDGPGVDETQAERLFEPGFTTKGERGSGLGLFLVKTTATAHGGGVRVGRSPEGGARFSLCLPARPRGSSTAFRPPLVLVADDERGLRRACARELAAAGLAVAEAASRAAALEIVDADPLRIVAAIIDRDLGDGSGADVARRIRSQNPRALIIETSAAPDEEGIVLEKPFDLGALTQRVLAAVRLYATGGSGG